MTKKKEETIAYHFEKIINALGLNCNDEHLRGTPNRVAKMFVNELFAGLDDKNKPAMTTFSNAGKHRRHGLIILRDIYGYSVCAHHFLPFQTRIHIAYLPNKKILGLSKFARIAKYFARRPQIQEQLTEQIADFLEETLSPFAVGVLIEGEHLCMSMRGVENRGAVMETVAFRGDLKTDRTLREQFFNAVNRSGWEKSSAVFVRK